MNKKNRCFTVFVCILAVLCVLPVAGTKRTSPKKQAKQILSATGVKGGLVVHVNCGDGRLTAALGANESFLVHGLDTDAADVAKARDHIRSRKLYGKVSVEQWTGDGLPYAENLVNLLVSEQPVNVPMEEVLRVLAPNGAAYVKQAGKWTKTVKPRPENIDQWTHYLHDATGNAVANDSVVGPPRRMQWLAAPTWTRNHHTLASISAVVSAEGRIFCIVDEGPAASMEVPAKWFLVARDAFNGVLLWKQPISCWAWHRRGFRSGPVQLPRTLVAVEDRVYVPLGIDAPATALDAATGKIVRVYEGTENTEEIILSDGVLLVVTGSPTAEQAANDPRRAVKAPFPNEKSVVAFEVDTGKELWKWSEAQSEALMPLTLAARSGRVFFVAGKGVVCLDSKTGGELWDSSPVAGEQVAKKPAANQKRKTGRRQRANVHRSVGWSVATLVVHDGIVLWADGRRLAALSAKTGKALWDCQCRPGFRSPVDVLVAGGLVWLGPDFAQGRDPQTGEVKKTNTVISDLWTAGHHHRCYREKATDRYIMTGKRGIEFVDLDSDNHSRNNWVRGACQYGVMPCNGLVYAPSHACGCFMEAKLYGFWALAPAAQPRKTSTAGAQLEKGPAYGKISKTASAAGSANDWPAQRHDPLRTGSTTMELPSRLRDIWNVSIGGRLSPPVAAAGSIIVSSIDAHRVFALDARDGKTRWSFTAGGRVDSAPTIYKGLVLFGSADGYIYCLRLSDGEFVWRFRAAPEELKTVALDQVESVWPVHGSVLVQNGVAYAAAGRSSYLDGGIVIYALEPATGRTVAQSRVRSVHPSPDDPTPTEAECRTMSEKIAQNATDYKTFTAPDKSDAFSMMGGATTDILVGDGTSIYMRQLRLDQKCAREQKQSRHLLSTSRLIDDAEVHRSHWVLGTGDFSRAPVAYSWIAFNPDRYGYRLSVPYGLMLTFDDETVWGVRRTKSYEYKLFADENRPFCADEPFEADFRKASEKNVPSFKWSVDLPMRPRAMIRAGGTVLLGGMPCEVDEKDLLAAYEGRKGGLLWATSPADGGRMAEYKLKSPPVWDGMAAANGQLYISTQDGSVLCMGRKP